MPAKIYARRDLESFSSLQLREIASDEFGKPALWTKSKTREELINLISNMGAIRGEFPALPKTGMKPPADDSAPLIDLDNLDLGDRNGEEVETIGEDDLKALIRAEVDPVASRVGDAVTIGNRAMDAARGAREYAEDQAEAIRTLSRTLAGAQEKIADLEKREIRPVIVQLTTGKKKTTIEAGAQHQTFPVLLSMVSAGCHVFLVGPAGSGKTRGGEEVARVMGRKFFPQSVGPQTTQSHLMGYMDAGGKYIRTAFRDAFELGGIFLLDEIDAGNPGVLTSLNSALANTYCSFPDGIIKRHADFICIAAGNTWGNGADRQYVGRNQIDAATLDRFAFLTWDYDQALETAIAGATDWTAYVQKIRARVFAIGARLVVSPRASIMGNNLLAAGVPRDQVEMALVWKGADRATMDKVKAGL